MPGLPNSQNPLIYAHLYTEDPLCDSKKDKPLCFVEEEGGYHKSEKNCNVEVNVLALDDLVCSLNVKRFVQLKRNCQWTIFMIYVDNILLPEVCADHKYYLEDFEKSGYELLSPHFKVSQNGGTIQLVIKTYGSGKKKNWPDYTIIFNYFKLVCEGPAKLYPMIGTFEMSRHFRDVEKRTEFLLNKLKQNQYNMGDRWLKAQLEDKAGVKEEAKHVEIKREPVPLRREESPVPDSLPKRFYRREDSIEDDRCIGKVKKEEV